MFLPVEVVAHCVHLFLLRVRGLSFYFQLICNLLSFRLELPALLFCLCCLVTELLVLLFEFADLVFKLSLSALALHNCGAEHIKHCFHRTDILLDFLILQRDTLQLA